MIRIGLSILISLTVAAALASTAGGDDTDSSRILERMWSIAEQLECPVCQGQSVRDSNAALATQMRATILAKLEAGESDDTIFAFFAARYGPGVLRDPPAEGIGLGLWVGPILAFGVGVFIVARAVSRRYAWRDEDSGDALRPYEIKVAQLRRRSSETKPKA